MSCSPTSICLSTHGNIVSETPCTPPRGAATRNSAGISKLPVTCARKGSIPVTGSRSGLPSSTSSPRDSPFRRGPFRQSITSNVEPKAQPSLSVRRISTVYTAPSSPASDSPVLQKTKSYSKWEKQDLEAQAMLKIRDKLQGVRSTEALRLASPGSATPAPAASVFGSLKTSTDAAKVPEKPAAASSPFTFGNTTASKPASAEPPKPNAIDSVQASSSNAEPWKNL